jgi:hypothetical protein
MLCFLTVRKLKPGSYESFREAWDPGEDVPAGFTEGFTRAYHLRNLEDENEVISFGFLRGGSRRPRAHALRRRVPVAAPTAGRADQRTRGVDRH